MQDALTGTMRDAVLGQDDMLYRNACTAAVMFSDYDLMPTLLISLTDASKKRADLAAETLMKLVAQLYDELASEDKRSLRRDPHSDSSTRHFLPGNIGAAVRTA